MWGTVSLQHRALLARQHDGTRCSLAHPDMMLRLNRETREEAQGREKTGAPEDPAVKRA